MKSKIFKRALIGLAILVVIFIVLLHSILLFFGMKMTEDDLNKEFKAFALKPQQHRYATIGNREMNYAEVGYDSLPVVLFVHGSPGSWTAFKEFFKDTILLSKVKMLSVDRPGFGYSDEGNAEPSLAAQAACIKPLLEKYKKNRPLILVGHSLGGPLIARIAMDYPELADVLIFVAPSVDPELEPYSWYRKPMDFFLIRWMFPSSMIASNQEIIPLKSELEQMRPLWKNIKQRCIVIQGDQDDLVPPGNALFIKKILAQNSTEIIMLKGMNHFIPWGKPEIIRAAIMSAVESK